MQLFAHNLHTKNEKPRTTTKEVFFPLYKKQAAESIFRLDTEVLWVQNCPSSPIGGKYAARHCFAQQVQNGFPSLKATPSAKSWQSYFLVQNIVFLICNPWKKSPALSCRLGRSMPDATLPRARRGADCGSNGHACSHSWRICRRVRVYILPSLSK